MSAQSNHSHASHESLCTNCGKCCYKKIIVGRTVFITPFPCEYLDTRTNLCTIYDRRHELNPLCLSIEAEMKVGAFPDDCPYVDDMAPKGYRPARDYWDWSKEWHDFDALAEDLEVSDEMREIVRARGPQAVAMYVEAFARIEQERFEQLLWGTGPVLIVNAAHAVNAPADAVPSLVQLAREGAYTEDGS